MTFDRAKIIAEGGTYHDEKNPLIECASFSTTKVEWASVSDLGAAPAEIKEDANLPKRMMIEGVFQRADVRNANQRVYPRSLFERLLRADGPVQRRIVEKAMIGHLEHPTEGATDLNKGAIRIEKVWMESDGTVMGRAMVYNTPEGQRIQEYITTGTKIGISSRGTGTVDAKGHVCEDYALETWDMVYNPSTPGAHPGLTSESVSGAGTKPVVETAPTSDNIQPHQDPPMSLSKRISEARAEASRLLAVDPKRLTIEGRVKLAGDLLDARAKLAKDFVGEDRVSDVEKILKALDEARKLAEGDDAAPQGQVDTGIPGSAWDVVDKAIGALGAGRTAVESHVKSMADLIAANLGKLPQLTAAVEAAAKGDDKPKVDEAKHEELKGLLRESRDEIILLTEREEAASAIIEELTNRVSALQDVVEAGKLRESKAATVIAELTASGGKPKADEAKDDKKADDKKANESVDAKPAAKSLAERIAEQAKKAAGGASELPEGKKTSSSSDAGDVKNKDTLHEGAETATTGKKSGAALLLSSNAITRITESQGTFR
jgi:hypothetical protein